MELIFEIIASEYNIDIPMDLFWKVLDKEEYMEYDYQMLYNKLNALDGVSDTDYGGFNVNTIYLRIEEEHDTPDTHRQIIDVIKNHLLKIKENENANFPD